MPLTKRPKMTTTKIAANRANAKKSTGPRTAAGKQRTRFNALTHGATARELKATMHWMGEDPDQYDRLREGFLASLAPANFLESYLLENMAETAWRQERLIRSQYAMQAYAVGRYAIDKNDGVERDRSMSVNANWNGTIRLEGQLSRHFERHFKMLLRLRAERRAERDESLGPGLEADSVRRGVPPEPDRMPDRVEDAETIVGEAPQDPSRNFESADRECTPEPADVQHAKLPVPDAIDPCVEENPANRTHHVDDNKRDAMLVELIDMIGETAEMERGLRQAAPSNGTEGGR